MKIFTKIIKYLFKLFKFPRSAMPVPIIIKRADHNLSRKKISNYVLKVLYTLKAHGYKSYLIGGGVRDLLLGFDPKDFDVVTDAYPEKIKKLFKRCYIIGKRFPLVHVYFEKKIVEVATFRAHHKFKHSKNGMILRDNVYGNIEQDALRRDFTINAIYYNINDYSLVDYVGGLNDLKAQRIRLIGDPVIRYKEDPVRMLRAIRFAAKLNFQLDPETAKPINELKWLLLNISPARLYDEYVKLFFTGHPVASFDLLKQYDLLGVLFPGFLKFAKEIECLAKLGFKRSEVLKELATTLEFRPACLLALLLWPRVMHAAKEYRSTQNLPEFLAYKKAGEQLLAEQNKILMLSKKLTSYIKDLWFWQVKLAKLAGKPGKRADKLLNMAKFSLGLEFLNLRALAKEQKAENVFRWWSKYRSTKSKNHEIVNIEN